ncbi:MAG: NAD(P)H-hydrate dehydratase [Eubacterium sp.]|nr:NAD(P)H-hydrate dehydratase [Eubacterium sp.]
MEYVLTAAEMKKCDERIMTEFKVPSCVLMERAALAVYDAIDDEGLDASKSLIVCGSGNNGGDGFALARMLYLDGYEPDVVLLGDKDKASEECARQMDIFTRYGGVILTEIPEDDYTLVVDAIFGVGLSRDIGGKYYDAIGRLNNMDADKLAVDIPSGISADNGSVMGIAFCADVTVTMAFAKYGQLLYPGREYVGELIVADIGIDENGFDEDMQPGRYLDDNDIYSLMPKKTDSSNKGTYGKVLSVTGSINMAGASYLSAKASYTTGCGLVYIYTPEENRVIMQTLIPEAVLCTYNEHMGPEDNLKDCLEKSSVCVLGCGLGTDSKSREIVSYILENYDKPLVIDADALNIIAKSDELKAALEKYSHPAYITPHMGEAKRLLKTEIDEIKKDPVKYAKELADTYKCVCILKDAATVIADKKGRVYVNTSGNGGMSKGGSGDVLSGILGGVLSCGAKGPLAGALAVYLHGAAGDEAAEEAGRYGMLAEDIIEGLKNVLKEIDENV